MARILLLLALSLFMGNCRPDKHSKKSTDFLSQTRKMVKDGKYREALDRFIKYHRNTDGSFSSPTRRSFALYYWQELYTKYPPALDSFLKIRNTDMAKIKENGATPDVFADVVAMNKKLGENAKSINLFEVVRRKYPERSNRYFIYIQNELFEARRFDILREYIKDPLEEYDFTEDIYKNDQKFNDRMKITDSAFRSISDTIFVTSTIHLIEFCKATNDRRTGTEIQRRALRIVDDKRLRNAM